MHFHLGDQLIRSLFIITEERPNFCGSTLGSMNFSVIFDFGNQGMDHIWNYFYSGLYTPFLSFVHHNTNTQILSLMFHGML